MPHCLVEQLAQILRVDCGEPDDHHWVILIVFSDEVGVGIGFYSTRSILDVDLDDHRITIVKQTGEELLPDIERRCSTR